MEKTEASVLNTQSGDNAGSSWDSSWALDKSTLGISGENDGHEK